MLNRQTRDRPKTAQAGPKFEVDEANVFGRFDLFAKRCRKLSAMFTTIEQFSILTEVCLMGKLSCDAAPQLCMICDDV